MAAFANHAWGRYVYVDGYSRWKNGKQERVRSHFRKWPGHHPGSLYFFY